MSEQKSTILITGGAGFIGSTLVRQWLAEERSSIVNLDKLTYAGHRLSLAGALDDTRHQLVEGDICDPQLVTRLLEQHRPWAIIHLAAETHVDRSIIKPPQFALTNMLGTCTLLDAATRYWQQLDEAARRAFRFLLVSTDEVFGTAAQKQVFDEQSPLAPNSPYAASKAGGEHLARAFANTYDLPILIANPSNNYGARQHPEKLIPKMILEAAGGHALPVYGDGLHQRDWLHVEDCCRALREILRRGSPGTRYLVGADNCLSNLRVVETVCDLLDDILADGLLRRRLISHVADRPGHDRRYAVSFDRLRVEIGWQPRIPFSEGLRNTIRWYLDHPHWVEKVRLTIGN